MMFLVKRGGDHPWELNPSREVYPTNLRQAGNRRICWTKGSAERGVCNQEEEFAGLSSICGSLLTVSLALAFSLAAQLEQSAA